MRLYEFRKAVFEDARIQHAEDVIFWEGSAGAKRVIDSIIGLTKGNTQSLTVKWDGSPAVIFGRDDEGRFVFTDKSGFVAKGYDGRATNGDDLEALLLNRGKGSEKSDDYKAFAGNMKSVFPVFEKAIPEDFRGYFKGDLLFFNTPDLSNGAYTFKPNIVSYTVVADSDIGKRIQVSKAGVVIHRIVDPDGSEKPLTDYDIFQGKQLLVLPPVTVQEPPQVDMSGINKISAIVTKNASAIDSLLNKEQLRSMKMTDFSNVLYQYVNSKTDTGLDNLGKDFMQWLQNSAVSAPKKAKMTEYVKTNIRAFGALWQVVEGIMKTKNNIIAQLENQPADVKASIGSKPGGEGYVLAHPDGDIKFVNRAGFSAANRAVQR
jgi:hypothetical protein|tara:strand:- start:7940 stop:9064 length:1125 start_codon:yes stop_codon:yes gene_type:complete